MRATGTNARRPIASLGGERRHPRRQSRRAPPGKRPDVAGDTPGTIRTAHPRFALRPTRGATSPLPSMDTTKHAMHHPAPYPTNLTWRHVMTRLFIVNELLVLVGALSMHATERLDPKLTQVMGLPYYLLWMHCIGFCALFINGAAMLSM